MSEGILARWSAAPSVICEKWAFDMFNKRLIAVNQERADHFCCICKAAAEPVPTEGQAFGSSSVIEVLKRLGIRDIIVAVSPLVKKITVSLVLSNWQCPTYTSMNLALTTQQYFNSTRITVLHTTKHDSFYRSLNACYLSPCASVKDVLSETVTYELFDYLQKAAMKNYDLLFFCFRRKTTWSLANLDVSAFQIQKRKLDLFAFGYSTMIKN